MSVDFSRVDGYGRWLGVEDGKSVRYPSGVRFDVLDEGDVRRIAGTGASARAAERRRAACFRGRFEGYSGARFDRLSPEVDARALDAAMRIASSVADGAGDVRSLVLFGDFGTGKTTLAACACNLVIDAGRRAAMTCVGDVESEVSARYGGSAEVYEALCRNDLVVVDDLAAEGDVGRTPQRVFELADWLSSQRRVPTIWTTNLTRGQLARPSGLMRRAVDRIKQGALLVEVAGPNFRNGRMTI